MIGCMMSNFKVGDIISCACVSECNIKGKITSLSPYFYATEGGAIKRTDAKLIRPHSVTNKQELIDFINAY